jgi:hypothetical protein
MMKENEDLLDEVYHATEIGLEATEALIPKVHYDPLREQIELQHQNYREMEQKTKAMLREDGRLPEERPPLKKAMFQGSIKVNTTMNPDPKHIAEMMITGTNMGIINITKKLNALEDADDGARHLAEDYIAAEQSNIEELKKYL